MAFSTLQIFLHCLLHCCVSALCLYACVHVCTVPVHDWNHIFWTDKKRLLSIERKWYSVFHFNIHFLHSYNAYCIVHESTASQCLFFNIYIEYASSKKYMDPLPREIIPSNWDAGSSAWDKTAITLLPESKGFLLMKNKKHCCCILCMQSYDRLLLGNATTSTF